MGEWQHGGKARRVFKILAVYAVAGPPIGLVSIYLVITPVAIYLGTFDPFDWMMFLIPASAVLTYPLGFAYAVLTGTFVSGCDYLVGKPRLISAFVGPSLTVLPGRALALVPTPTGFRVSGFEQLSVAGLLFFALVGTIASVACWYIVRRWLREPLR